MYKDFEIKLPFFEMGPKAYLYGEETIAFAKAVDEISEEYDVPIILDPQYTDIPIIAKETKNLLIFAQHMDSLHIGRGVGSILPEAIKAAGAVGVMLNHAEKRISLSELNKTIKRADQVGLATMVCADTIEEAAMIAHLNPNIIIAEDPELIGSGKISEKGYIKKVMAAVHAINPHIYVLQGAGISSGKDVYSVIESGAVATGSSSGIFKAVDPIAMAREMIHAIRQAWNEFHK